MVPQKHTFYNPINIGVGKDNLNDFARKYNLEIEHIYDIFNQYATQKVIFYSTSDKWSKDGEIYKFTVQHNGSVCYAVYRRDDTVDTQVLAGIQMDDSNIIIEAMEPFDGFLMMMAMNDLGAAIEADAKEIARAKNEALKYAGQAKEYRDQAAQIVTPSGLATLVTQNADNISKITEDLKELTERTSAEIYIDKQLDVTADTGFNSATSIIDVNISLNEEYGFEIVDDIGAFTANYALYEMGSDGVAGSSVKSCKTNQRYILKATKNVAHFSIYIARTSVVASGPLKIRVTRFTENSIEQRVVDLEEKTTEFVQNNVLYHQDVVEVTGSGQYVFKELLDITDLKPTDIFVFSVDKIEGVVSLNPITVDLFNGESRVETVACRLLEDSKVIVNIGLPRYIEAGVNRAKFVLYPTITGGLDKAVYTNVSIVRGTGEKTILNNIGVNSISSKAFADHVFSDTVMSVAHRGYYRFAPMCSKSAVIAAKRKGYRCVENDLALSKDGKIVLWHDSTLNKLGDMVDINGYEMYVDANNNPYWYDRPNDRLYTWANGYIVSYVRVDTLTRARGSNFTVSDFDFDILKRIDFGVYYNTKFKGEQIMSLEEWVMLCKKLGLQMFIDHKLTYTREIAKEAVDTVRNHGMLRNVYWIVSELNLIREQDNKAKLRLLVAPTEENTNNPSWLNALAQGGEGSVGFDSNIALLTEENCRLALEKGFALGCYYVDFNVNNYQDTTSKTASFDLIERVIDYGIQEITLDEYTVEEIIAERYLQE